MAARQAGVDNDVLSAFAQFNWHVNDTFLVQVGGRVTQDDRDGFRQGKRLDKRAKRQPKRWQRKKAF